MTCTPGKDCGHWQLATSAETWRVGCGYAKCPKLKLIRRVGDSGIMVYGANYVVCNYWPAQLNHMKFERGERCSNCAYSINRNRNRYWQFRETESFKCENELCVPCDPKTAGCTPLLKDVNPENKWLRSVAACDDANSQYVQSTTKTSLLQVW